MCIIAVILILYCTSHNFHVLNLCVFPNFVCIQIFLQYYRAMQLHTCTYDAASTVLCTCTCSLLYACTKNFSQSTCTSMLRMHTEAL